MIVDRDKSCKNSTKKTNKNQITITNTDKRSTKSGSNRQKNISNATKNPPKIIIMRQKVHINQQKIYLNQRKLTKMRKTAKLGKNSTQNDKKNRQKSFEIGIKSTKPTNISKYI